MSLACLCSVTQLCGEVLSSGGDFAHQFSSKYKGTVESETEEKKSHCGSVLDPFLLYVGSIMCAAILQSWRVGVLAQAVWEASVVPAEGLLCFGIGTMQMGV